MKQIRDGDSQLPFGQAVLGPEFEQKKMTADQPDPYDNFKPGRALSHDDFAAGHLKNDGLS